MPGACLLYVCSVTVSLGMNFMIVLRELRSAARGGNPESLFAGVILLIY